MGTQKAKAPRPGASRREEAAKAAAQLVRIRIKDEERTVSVGTVSMRTRTLLDLNMGLSFEECFMVLMGGGFKLHAVFGVWFCAGHQADPTLTYEADEAAFNALILSGLGEGDIEAEVLDPEDSPEA